MQIWIGQRGDELRLFAYDGTGEIGHEMTPWRPKQTASPKQLGHMSKTLAGMVMDGSGSGEKPALGCFMIGRQAWLWPSMCGRAAAICCVLLLTASAVTHAQDEVSSIGQAFKSAVLDPTTYPAPVLYYDAATRDWKSSQPLLRNGFVEQNPRFTLSGFSNDRPVSYEAGNDQILRDAFSVLAVTAAHNIANRLIEAAMKARYPQHRKMIGIIGWVERIGLSSYVTYYVSAPHYRQWKRNERLAAQLGLR